MVSHIELLSLADVGFTQDIPEPFHTFEENARTKAETIAKHAGKNAFADDSGICVNALNGEPGVDSAHYAGPQRNDGENLQKLLNELKGKADRTAYYKAVICLIWDGEVHLFEGRCDGFILEAPRGDGGFGYDPIFVPEGYERSFGELPPDIKNKISHRGKAVRQMIAFLKEKTGV